MQVDSYGVHHQRGSEGVRRRRLMQNPDFPAQRSGTASGSGSSSSSSSYYSTTSTTSSSSTTNTQYGRRQLLSIALSMQRQAAVAARAIFNVWHASYTNKIDCPATGCVTEVTGGVQRRLSQNPDFPAQRDDMSSASFGRRVLKNLVGSVSNVAHLHGVGLGRSLRQNPDLPTQRTGTASGRRHLKQNLNHHTERKFQCHQKKC